MKLGYKLLIAPALTAAIVLAAGQTDSFLLSRAADEAQALFQQRVDGLRTVTSAQDQLSRMHAGVYRTMSIIGSLDDVKTKALRADLVREADGVKRVLGAVADGSLTDAALRSALDDTGKQLDKYRQQADAAVDLASVDPNTGVAAMQGADATFSALAKSMGAVVARIEAVSADSADSARTASSRLHWLLALLALASAGIAIGLSWMMQRRVVHDLASATQVAREVAAGNLQVTAESTRNDEVGELMRALGAMTRQLETSLQAVQSSSDSIRTASAEIASGNHDLSARTEQTASNLQQAASSMDQLTGTVRQSADAARQANQLASSAADVAQRGGAVVSQVVSTMDEINTSSKKIADIIGTIDGIAFQTNILALNAAVEAARAGEQGRGFAVVAGEVRSLAQRSAEAAREIKTLIGSSVDKVETGSRLVADAGSTMNEIVASVQRVSDIIGEITAASAEQSTGIGQVSSAVTELDRMTQQNAALVEQSAAAAESLKEQALRLNEVVGAFRLSGPSRAPETARARPEPPKAAPTPSLSTAAYRGEERRGPARAKNVVRPPFTAKPSSKVDAAPAALKSGTDDEWESF
jgi:methyl-accepting chemotaxis protein